MPLLDEEPVDGGRADADVVLQSLCCHSGRCHPEHQEPLSGHRLGNRSRGSGLPRSREPDRAYHAVGRLADLPNHRGLFDGKLGGPRGGGDGRACVDAAFGNRECPFLQFDDLPSGEAARAPESRFVVDRLDRREVEETGGEFSNAVCGNPARQRLSPRRGDVGFAEGGCSAGESFGSDEGHRGSANLGSRWLGPARPAEHALKVPAPETVFLGSRPPVGSGDLKIDGCLRVTCLDGGDLGCPPADGPSLGELLDDLASPCRELPKDGVRDASDLGHAFGQFVPLDAEAR